MKCPTDVTACPEEQRICWERLTDGIIIHVCDLNVDTQVKMCTLKMKVRPVVGDSRV